MADVQRGHGDTSAYRRPRGGSNVEPVSTPAARHCWLVTSHDRQAVLLLDWRRDEDGLWEGYVVRPIPGGFAATWVSAVMLRPSQEQRRAR